MWLMWILIVTIPLATALDFDNVYFQPSESNTTYLINTTLNADNITINETHLGFDDRKAQIIYNDTLDVEVTNIQTALDLSSDILYTITYVITGAVDTFFNLSYDADFLFEDGASINGNVFFTNDFNFTGTSGTLRLFELQEFQFNFNNELTEASINNVTFQIISDEVSYSYLVENGTQNVSLPNSPGEYLLRYSADGYSERFYNFVVSEQTSEIIDLYLINTNASDIVSVSIIDESGDPVESALVKVLRYDILDNAYKIIESATTNVDGIMLFEGQLNEEYYKFIIEYPLGTTKRITNPSYLYSTTIEIQISLGEDVLEKYNTINNIATSLFYNEGTNNFHFTYNDPANEVTQGCLSLYGLRGTSEYFLNESCASGSAGTILMTVTNDTYPLYNTIRGDAYVTLDGESSYLESVYQTFSSDLLEDPNYLVYVFILTMLVFLIFLFSPALATIFIPTPTLLFSLVGLIPIAWYVILPVQVVFIGMGVAIGKRG